MLEVTGHRLRAANPVFTVSRFFYVALVAFMFTSAAQGQGNKSAPSSKPSAAAKAAPAKAAAAASDPVAVPANSGGFSSNPVTGGVANFNDGTVIENLRVEGLHNIEAGTVYGYLPLRVGDTITPDRATNALRALYASGLFKDVKLRMDGGTLVITVAERPGIASVEFNGMKEFSKDVVLKAMREGGISEGRPYSEATVASVVLELKRQYFDRGYYSVQITPQAKPNEQGNVALTFNVAEGGQTKIRSVHIVGNQAFSESTLLDQINLSGPTWLTWYTKANQFSESKLNADVESLRSYYLQRGYLEFRITSTEVYLSPARDAIDLKLVLSEGPRYTVTGFRLSGDYLGRDKEFESLVALKEGDTYNVDQLNQSTRAISDKFASLGYAFSVVNAVPQIDSANAKVFFTIESQPRARVYVRRINIQGNSRTRDEVIRREMRQSEAAWYDANKIRLSRDRIDRLGFFKSVDLSTQDVPDTNDQVDLIVKVEEKPTAAISVGASYSSADKLGFTASINQDNAFGSGNSIALSLDTSSSGRTLSLTQFTPYVNDYGLSRTTDIYYRTIKPYSAQGSDYSIVTPGAKLSYGIPITEFDTLYAGAGVERYSIKLDTGAPTAYVNYVNQFGEKTTGIPLTLGWSRDERDSALVPSTGSYKRLFAEYSPGTDLKYLRGSAQYQLYLPLTRRFTLAFNTQLDTGRGLGGHPLPLFKLYYGGGLGSVRGYATSSLGPRDSDGNSTGGNKRFQFNTEFLSNFPGAGADRTLRWFVFVDGGNVWGEDQKLGEDGLRYSYGAGISWVSPIGPLKFSYGYPLNAKPGDSKERFQFQIGTAF